MRLGQLSGIVAFLKVAETRSFTRAAAELGMTPPSVSEADAGRDGVDGCVDRLDEIAHRWHALQPGRSLTLTWPRGLTVDPGRVRAGRRTQKSATQRRGRGH